MVRRFAVLLLVVCSVSLHADTFTLFSSGGNWSNTGIWYQNGVPATRTPGSAPGIIDIVDLTTPSFFTVTMDTTLSEAVTLNSDCPSNTSTCVVDVTIGTLWLTSASSIGVDARLKLSGGGTVKNDGALVFNNSNFDWTNGTLTGSGLTTVSAGAFLNATGIAHFIDGHALSIFGTMTYTPPASGLSLQNGGNITIQSGGVLDIQTTSSINSNFAGSPFIDVLSGGIVKKTTTNGSTNITPVLNNDGTVQVDVNTLVLTSGVHQGVFNMNGAGTGIEFAGSPSLLGGADIQGAGTAKITGTMSLGGAVTATNLSLDGGTITGNAPLDVSGTFMWNGGTITGNAQVSMLTGSTMDYTAVGNGTLTGIAHLRIDGTFNVLPGTGSFSIDSGGHIEVNGDMNIVGDFTIFSDNVNNARIDINSGKTLDKTTGTGIAYIEAAVNNSGTLSVFSGALKLIGGGAHSSTFFTGGTSGLAFDGYHTFNAGSSLTGTGTYVLFGTGVMDVDTPLTVPATATFQQLGGTLTGAGDFTVAGTFLWQNGNQDYSGGFGETLLTGSSSLIAPAGSIGLSRDMRNSGTVTYDASGGTMQIDEIFENSGTFNFAGDGAITGSGSFGGTSGVINKTAGAGDMSISPAYVGGGTINLSSGTITLTGTGGFNLGTVNFGGASNKLIIAGNGFTIGTSPSFTGPGALRLTSPGSLALNAPVTLANLEFISGVINGTANLTINNSLLWTGGTFSTSGTTTIAAPAVVDATSPTTTLGISNGTFAQQGTFNWNGTSQALDISFGATLVNSGTFDAQGAGMITGTSGGSINNSGSFKKSGGASGTNIGVPIANSGSLDSQVSGQSLIIAGGGSMSAGGSLTTSAGALLDFFGGTFTMTGGSFTGSGVFRVNGGTLAVDANATIPSPAVLKLETGTLSVGSAKTVQVFNSFDWTGGTLQGPGTLRVFGGAIGNSAPTTMSGDATLTVPASAFSYNANSVNYLTINDTSNLNVETGGAFSMTADSRIDGNIAAAISYAGTFRKTGGAGITQINLPVTSSSGTAPVLGVNTGTLQLTAGATLAHGTIDIQSGATLDFSAGNVNISAPASVSGTGTFSVTGASVNASQSLTLSGPFMLTGGTMGGTGTLTLNGNGTWKSGTLGSPVVLNSTFDLITPSARTISSPFENNGILNLTDGTLDITVSSNTHTGAFNVGAGTTLSLGGAPTFGVSSSISGAGDLAFLAGADITINGSYAIGGTTVMSATFSNVTFNAAASTGRAVLSGGLIDGTGSFTIGNVAPASTWTGTSFGGTGALTLDGDVTLNPSAAITLARSMTINSLRTLTVTGGAFAITSDGSAITNNGTFQITSNNTWNTGTGGGTLTNNGTFKVTSAVSSFQPTLTNANLVELTNGTLNLTAAYTQSAGTTKLNPGTLGAPSLTFNGGSLIGTGTISGNVINNGAAVAPGLSAGGLTINGNYTQSASGILNMEIGGINPGTQYDQIDVNGLATLDGTINVALIGGFSPANNDVFDLLTYTSRSGVFATENLPTFGSGGFFNRSYLANAYELVAVGLQSDLQVTQTSSGNTHHGQTVTFTVTVKNNGPDSASAVVLTDTITGGTVQSVSSTVGCTGTSTITCNFGVLASGQSVIATITVLADTVGTMTSSASVTTSTFDPVSTNDSNNASVVIAAASDVAITKSGPTMAQGGDIISYTITVTNAGPDAAANVIVSDPLPANLTFLGNSGDCTTNFPCALGTVAASATKTITSQYHVQASFAGGSITNTASVTTDTLDTNAANNSASATTFGSCPDVTPVNLAPNGGTAPRNGALTWDAVPGATYEVFFGPAGSGCSTFAGTTDTGSFAYSGLIGGASYEWRVRATFGGCETVSSACMTFTAEVDCFVPAAPVARVVGQTTSAKNYEVEWDVVPGATRYEVDEAANADFTNATTFSVGNTTSKTFKHDVDAATAFYYRVRAFTDCTPEASANSLTVRVVIIPLTPQPSPNVNVPVGTEEQIVQQVFIPGEPGQTLFYSATTDRPWLSVQPPTGVLPPQGVTLNVVSDPKNLPNGTFTATVIVTVTGGTISSHATSVSIPISINLVTPVTPVPSKSATADYALIIPAVGHASGLNSQWQSDVRVTNAGFRNYRYRLTFTPAGGTSEGVKQTDITVGAGETTALDDIVRNWYGLGTLGDGTTGMLEIVPIDDPEDAARVTVASSRTYNVTAKGTLGEFMPAVPFRNFVGATLPGALGSILSMQQIAQNDRFRTNVGLAEAAGVPADVMVSVFSSSGAKLLDFPQSLAGGQQIQINGLLSQHGISASDARVEVQVTGGEGKVTAYASVIDGGSGDPLLVRGTPLVQNGVSRYVLPGVANADTGFAKWRSDMRVFNYGTTAQPATLTFFPLGGGTPKSAQITANAGEVLSLDNVVKNLFGGENTGGAIHLNTDQPSTFIVSARTYNETANGTFGQFIPAVTVAEAAGAADARTLHILQVEDSVRHRTNIGIAEVSGEPAVVEVMIFLPDSKITPVVEMPLNANEFRQFAPIRELGLGNVYNARVTVRVISGNGRVTAYGAIIDDLTGDPTYVPAQ